MTNSHRDLEPTDGLKDRGEKMEESMVLMESLSANAVVPIDQKLVVQDMLQQLMTVQKGLERQMSSIVIAPVAKEGKRVEAALDCKMEMPITATLDALWARTLEENAKREKVQLDRVQHLITNMITDFFSEELPAIFGRTLQEEIMALGPVVARAVTPFVGKTISAIVTESVQGVGDKVMNQLNESIASNLEGSVERQLKLHFQSSGNNALQEAMRASLDTSIIPSFERSCKMMFDQVDNTFHKGMAEHTSAIQQQIEAAHTPLVLTLRDTISSASSITQSLSSELLDGQRKLLASGLPHMVEAPMDPTKELARLISEKKYEEAFNAALQLTDVSIVSWLCSQVDLHALCTMVPIPISQVVLLSLFQQLACDIANDTARKATWMTDVAVTINPSHPSIEVHVRPIFNQVYKIVSNHRATSASDAAKIKLVIHVINSVLVGFK